VRECTLLGAAQSQVEEESPEAGAGKRRQVGLQEILVVVAATVEGSPEGVEKRVRLGNLEVVVGRLLRLEENLAEVAVPVGLDVTVRVVRFLEEDPPAWECRRLYLLPPLLWKHQGEGPLAWGYRRRCPLLLPRLVRLPGLHPSTTDRLLAVAENEKRACVALGALRHISPSSLRYFRVLL
jgi:hypothetical protein